MFDLRIIGLVCGVLMSLSCGEGDEPAAQAKGTLQNNSSTGNNAAVPDPEPIDPEPKKMGALHLYRNSFGAFYEVLQLAEDPFNGVHYPDDFFDDQNKDPKTEHIFKNGKLTTRVEYRSPAIKKQELGFWDNGGIKHDIRFNSGGAPISTNRFNENGEALNQSTILAPGRRMNWYSGGGKGTIEFSYWNANTNLVRRDLGSPDKIEGSTWTYRNMKMTDTRTRQKRTTIRFHFGSVVTNIVVQP